MRRLLSITALVVALIALSAAPGTALTDNQGTFKENANRNNWGGNGGPESPCGSMFYIANHPSGTQSLTGFYFDTRPVSDTCSAAYQVLEFFSLDGTSTLTMFVAADSHVLIDQQQLKDMGYYGFTFTTGNGGGLTSGDPCTAWDHPATFIVSGSTVAAANCPST